MIYEKISDHDRVPLKVVMNGMEEIIDRIGKVEKWA